MIEKIWEEIKDVAIPAAVFVLILAFAFFLFVGGYDILRKG